MIFSCPRHYRVIILLVSLALIAGCGIKGPPLPPLVEGNNLARPTNLRYSMDKNQVSLSWDHAVDPVNAKIQPEAFRVYMAIRSKDDCQGCPFVFESIGEVPMPRMVFLQKIEQGKDYYFRVQAIGEDDIKSPMSNPVQVSFE